MRKNAIICCLFLFCLAAIASSGCADSKEKSVHVTAILEVQVLDESGKPVVGQEVEFKSVKITGFSILDETRTTLTDWTDNDGKVQFTVGYNLKRDDNYEIPLIDTLSLLASIPGATDTAAIGYREAEEQAGGTGIAVITKRMTLTLPDYVARKNNGNI